MKKLLSVFILFMLLLGIFPSSPGFAAPDTSLFQGQWACTVTKAELYDLNSLRSQLEKQLGEKISEEQWNLARQTLVESQNSALNEMDGATFTLDIYDTIGQGLKADIIDSSGAKTTSTKTSYSGSNLLFNFNQFLDNVKSDSLCTLTLTPAGLTGTVHMVTTISESGMSISLKTAVSFKGTLSESYVVPEEKPEPEGLDILLNNNILSTLRLKTGDSTSLKYRIYPEDYDRDFVKRVEWYSNDEKIATVNQSGKITAIQEGETQVVVWINGDYNLSSSIDVIVSDSYEAPEAETPASEPDSSEAGNPPASPSEPDAKQDEPSPAVKEPKPEQEKPTEEKQLIDTVQDATTGFADIMGKVGKLLPEPETVSKVPLFDILVFSYEVDKDTRENQGKGDSEEFAKQKSFWGNVLATGPIGTIPKVLDALLEISKKTGLDFDFSFENTIKGTSNFLFDMFGSKSKADIEEIKKRHLENHYGVLGGFGAWVSSAINDVSNWGSKIRKNTEDID